MKAEIHILILDDDPDTLELIKAEFDKAAIEKYKTYTDASEFLDNLDCANIAIMDHRLDGILGFNIIENIHQHNKLRRSIAKIKVIVISGDYDVDVPAHYMNTQKARVYLNKNSRKYNFYEALVDWTKIVIEEVSEDIAYDRRLSEREKKVTAILSAHE